jgi:hypothetical protein
MKREGYLIIFLLALYFGVLQLRENQAGPEIIRFHLSNLIFIPLLLLSVSVMSQFVGRALRLHTKEAFIAVLYSSLVFEVQFNFGIDFADVLCYMLGAFLYLGIKNSWHTEIKKRIAYE